MFTVKDQDPQKKAVASRSKGLDGQTRSGAQMREPVSSLQSLQRNLGNGYLQASKPTNTQMTTDVNGLRLQRACACGSTCAKCAAKGNEQQILQPKLTIGSPNDRYEQEADRIADQVIRMPEPTIQRRMDSEEEEEIVQRKVADQITPLVQRQALPEVEEEEEEVIQTKTIDNQVAPSAPSRESSEGPSSVHEVLNSPGQPLDPVTRAFMEPRFGHDFSRVRVHSDAAAEQSARNVNATAYTVGHNIVFGGGRFAPETSAGKRLLAHELTHVVQQRQGLEAEGQTGMLLAQRQPFHKDPRGQAPPKQDSQPVQSLTKTVNDPRMLWIIDLEGLGHLYASTEAKAALTRTGITFFTAAWIEGKEGREAIQEEILKRIALASDYERTAFLNFIDSMHLSEFDSSRMTWLRYKLSKSLLLTHEQRLELRRVVGNRMIGAYTNFSGAAEAVLRSIKAAVTTTATIVSVIFDIFMGFAAPGFAKGIAALANKLPVNASNIKYIAALELLDTKRTEQLFAAATKAGKEAIKANANALFGETDTDIFIRNLKSAFYKAVINTDNDLPNRTDQELGVLAVIYDQDISNEANYILSLNDLVNRFQQQVLPIGEKESVIKIRLAWAQVGSAEYLVQYYGGSYNVFLRFIDSDLKDAALARADDLEPPTGSKLRFKREGRIQTLPVSSTGVLISGHINEFPKIIPAKAARK